MNLQKMLEFRRRMKKLEVDLEGDEVEIYLEESGNYINKKAEQGKSLILSRMAEEDFVQFLDELENLISSTINSEGIGIGLYAAKVDGSIKKYTHTIILATLAILMDEEVI